MNYDKTVVYDERPAFESYNAMSMQYPNMPVMPAPMGMIPNMGMYQNNNNMNSYNQLESRVSALEKKVQNLETSIQRLQNNIYPKAVDYTEMSSDYINASYQNSMNIM
ncbi:MAG: hypothetical protein J6J17_01430 [Bacilli bacterium]|nr:hypothetical protein [Bacilli bacterium]